MTHDTAVPLMATDVASLIIDQAEAHPAPNLYILAAAEFLIVQFAAEQPAATAATVTLLLIHIGVL